MKLKAIFFLELVQNLKRFDFKGPYSGGKASFYDKG
jgi:hypothetical protein